MVVGQIIRINYKYVKKLCRLSKKLQHKQTVRNVEQKLITPDLLLEIGKTYTFLKLYK